MATIVVNPRNARITRSDLLGRRPDWTVVQPDEGGVLDTLSSASDPVALLTTNHAWEDEYLTALEPGDWVATTATGYDIYDLDEFEERDLALTHMPTVYGSQMAEHVFGLLFAISRGLARFRDRQRTRSWDRDTTGMTDFDGLACSVVGVGHIGEAIARSAKGFGMEVRGVKRSVAGYDGPVDEIYGPDELSIALEGASALFLSVPLTEETEGLIGRTELDSLADGAVVINVARGPVLDTDALLSALDEGHLRGAGIDTFDEEPLPEESSLWDREDVVISPHVGGWSDRLPGRAEALFVEQADLWLAGEDVPHRLV